MKLFGKKDDTPTDAPELDSPDEGAGAADGEFGDPAAEEASGAASADPAAESAAEAPAEEAGELTAPARASVAGGGKKKLLIGLLALVILGGLGGGGYFYFMTGSDTPMPAHPVRTANVAPPPAAPGKTDVAVASPAPATPPAAPAAASPPPTIAMPAAPVPVAATPPGAPPAIAAATPPAAPPGLGPPPAEEATAVPLTPAGTARPAAPRAPAALEAPGEEPPADLPMPAGVTSPPPSATMPGTPAATAPAATVAATATPSAPAAPDAKKPPGKGKTAAAGNGKGAEPSDAEKAIVQNAAVLDQLSPNTPAGPTNRPFDPSQAPPDQSAALKTVDQLLEQPAIVRPLPPAWLTVKRERASDDVDTRLTIAREALAQNNNTAALQLFTEIGQKYPKDKRILMGRAVALQKLGQDDSALAAYEDVLNHDPKNLEALTNMLGLLKKKDPKLAVEKLEQLREAYPYNADITAQLGISCGAAGRYEDAMKYLDIAEALSPGSAYVLYNKAVLYDKMGNGRQAGELYRQVIHLAADGSLDQTLPLDAIKRRLAVLR